MNLALGAKIVWQIIHGENSWWKDMLRKKYLTGSRRRCLDVIPYTQNCSPDWELCQNAAFVIQNSLK